MRIHTVQRGECLSSIAERYGLFWSTIWNHPENVQLKQQRKDPNVLYAGDIVHIPDIRVREDSCATDQKHRFRKKGVPAKLRLRLTDGDQPRPNVPYQLEIDGQWFDGATDGDGYLEHPIPPTAAKGKLTVGEGTTQDVFELEFGALDPVDTEEGVAGRLADLGYGTDDVEEALRAFQEKYRLPVTGTADEATRQRLREVFGQ